MFLLDNKLYVASPGSAQDGKWKSVTEYNEGYKDGFVLISGKRDSLLVALSAGMKVSCLKALVVRSQSGLSVRALSI